MRGWATLCFVSGLAAQQTAPVGVVRGTLLTLDGGELSVQAADNQVYRFQFDAKTTVEIRNQPAAMAGLAKGDPVEIVSDRGGDPLARYARIVKVVTTPRLAGPARRPPQAGSYTGLLDDLYSRGNLTFAGIVTRVDRDLLVLRTRVRGEIPILLRPDTRYFHDGVSVDASNLAVNTRVFVRGGNNLEERIEAYKVMWGRILKPE